MKKKALALVLAVSMTMPLMLSACGSQAEKEETEQTGMANPNLYDVGAEEADKIISLPAPEGAENVVYNIIGYEDENPTVELQFDLDGVTYYERAKATSLLTLLEGSDDMNADASALAEAMTAIPENEEINISGIYGDFDTSATTVVSYCDGLAFGSKEGSFVVWIDAVPGIIYNLATTDKVDLYDLQTLADQIFVSVQGED